MASAVNPPFFSLVAKAETAFCLNLPGVVLWCRSPTSDLVHFTLETSPGRQLFAWMKSGSEIVKMSDIC
jgi:hypothetical protein